jgi:transcriptional regulator with XRE-family HTH domain
MPSQLDLNLLGERLKETRQQKGKSLRDVFEATGVSVPTLSRIERGEANDNIETKTLASLAKWMEVGLDTFFLGSASSAMTSTPDIVELHLRADKNLSPKTAKALSKTFRMLYEQLSSRMSEK